MNPRASRGSAASLPTPQQVAASPLGRYRDLLDDWDAFAAALCRPLAPCIWANPSRIAVADLIELLAAEGIAAVTIPWLPGALRLPVETRAGQHWWYCAGLAHAQEEVSQLPALLLDLVPGQRVLDLCAAPGGKTAQIALALGNRGTLIANDIAAARIKALQGNLDRLGILNCSTTCTDGANWPAAAGQFDRILVDAPCSSEGTLRRSPPLLERLDPGSPARLAPRQRALLRKAVQRLKPGGRLVYSTCTFAPEENECTVAAVMAEYPGQLRLVPIALPGLIGTPGITHWEGRDLPAELALALRIWPHHNDSGGFFIAVLEKDARTAAEPDPLPAPLDPSDGADWLPDLSDHYGLPTDWFRHLRAHRQTRRGLHLMAADHCPPALPRAEGSGLFFHRTNVRPPKPTTSAALLFGPAATRFHLALTQDQRERYLRREQFDPTPAQAAANPPGQVVVSYRGAVLGVAILHRSGIIESLFPSRWSGCTGGS
ncbi:RsmB/NOP family class I SAM-dependent RNA methyltransferase [Candidatus Thiodictyon syntrophicum]|jgi:NOL1/NOP2/sun family putative RNA methylase|uniref:RNA methyltransferase n=1 Tax=Candidatus Thiodictyon syntrophicum TaxID=1166950 RepID=A0A2K8U8X5_9GAMM|nr:RsmB/NOP family class I SAM-dependent RNA methyltransferase [Candidatus Thiodictyon syntrophicum]AUB82005.1 RNA methyltransferase [Candidatus Thiodictyon syntrophicum]